MTTTNTNTNTNTTIDFVCMCQSCAAGAMSAVRTAPIGFYRVASSDFLDRQLFGEDDHFEAFNAQGERIAYEATNRAAADAAYMVLMDESRKLASCGATP